MNIPRTVAAVSAMTALVAASGADAGERLHSEWPWIGKNAEALEFRFGGAFYDMGPATRHDEDGFVANGELLLPSPALLSGIGSPRPYVGADLAIVEDGAEPVHVVYAGLNWQAHWSERFYTSASLGGSYNTADLSNPSPNHRDSAATGCSMSASAPASISASGYPSRPMATISRMPISVSAMAGWNRPACASA